MKLAPFLLPKWTVGWGFTTRCDLSCPFCYSGVVRKEIQEPEVPLKHAETFLKNNQKYIRSINFGTGECLLAPNFYNLLKLCCDYIPKVKIAITTNGSLADVSKTTQEILKNSVTECDVSLDFAKEEQHDNWRNKIGTWRRAINAIEMALKFGFHTSVVMVGTRQTLDEDNISGLLKIAERYKIAFRINLFMPTQKNFSFVPSVGTILSALKVIQNWSSAIGTSDRLFGQFLPNSLDKDSNDAKHSCRIMPNGNISPSTYLFNTDWINQTSLQDIKLINLEKSKPFIKYNSCVTPPECKNCSNQPTCKGGSVERRWLWYGSLYKADPFCPILFYPNYKTDYWQMSSASNKPWDGPMIHLDYLPTIIALPPTYLVPSKMKAI